MNWGNIGSHFIGFGWKRLSSHEINPDVSNGHEFQGVSGLRHLFDSTARTEYPATYYLIGDDNEDLPTVFDYTVATATWYDARENRKRKPEWRLYYPAKASKIQAASKPGDLIIIGLRRTRELSIMLIQQRSRAEVSISNLLGIGRLQEKGTGHTRVIDAEQRDIGITGTETLEHLANSVFALSEDITPPLPFPEPNFSRDTAIQKVTEAMAKKWPTRLGSCKEIHDLVTKISGLTNADLRTDPDTSLIKLLEVCEASYRSWEKLLLKRTLADIRYNHEISDESLAASVSQKWMSIRQGRVSRAGTMLELFLHSIFKANSLKFERNPRIEGGKIPDFLFPDCASYNDSNFPAERIRILGAKTSFKDRWRQILAEGERVKAKHGATRDDGITPTIFKQMADQSFTVVMPQPIRESYAQIPRNLISLSDFIDEVRSISQ